MNSRLQIVGQCEIFSLQIANAWLRRLFSLLTTAGIFIFLNLNMPSSPKIWQCCVCVMCAVIVLWCIVLIRAVGTGLVEKALC